MHSVVIMILPCLSQTIIAHSTSLRFLKDVQKSAWGCEATSCTDYYVYSYVLSVRPTARYDQPFNFVKLFCYRKDKQCNTRREHNFMQIVLYLLMILYFVERATSLLSARASQARPPLETLRTVSSLQGEKKSARSEF